MAHPPGNRNIAADVATAPDRRNGPQEGAPSGGLRSRVPGEPPGPRFARPEGKLRETRDPEAARRVAPGSRLSRANWHLAQKGAPRRALGRDTSALPLTRCDRARRLPLRRSRRFLFTMSNSPVSSLPARCCVRVLFLPLFTFVAADPRARGLAERREASSLEVVAQVTRDATLARHGPSRATGRPASRRSAVALSAQVPPPSPLPGPARRLHAPLARLPGCGCRAFRVRGYQPRSTPHPAPPSGSLLESAPHERDLRYIALAREVVNR
jgi:hypothetical protein